MDKQNFIDRSVLASLLRPYGNRQTVSQHGDNADVVDDIRHCAETDANHDRENPNQSQKQRKSLGHQANSAA